MQATIKQSILSIVIGLALVAGISWAWTEPSANPPGDNVAAPINVGSTAQIKDGVLQVNGFKNIGDSVFDGQIQIGSSNIASNPIKNGSIRYNSASKDFEGYNGTGWLSFTKSNKQPRSALYETAGLSSFTVPAGVTTVWLSMVGGGGGGGGGQFDNTGDKPSAGGGGAGSFSFYKKTVTPETSYAVKVGAGGAKGEYTGTEAARNGKDGESSYFSTGASQVFAYPGGGGSYWYSNGGGTGGITSPTAGGVAGLAGVGASGTGGAGGKSAFGDRILNCV